MRAVVFVSTVENPEEPMGLCVASFQSVADNEIVNDFDLIAVEAAVQLKEAGALDSVVVFGVGTEIVHLQKCLAMGCDKAIHAMCDRHVVTPNAIVETALSALDDAELSETIWMFGKLGVNFEHHETAQRLAVRLGVPCLSSAHTIERIGENWVMTCESESGIPTFQVQGGFVLTADLRLAEPRFPSLPNIVRAKKKPIESVAFVDSPGGLKTQGLEQLQGHQRTCVMKDLGAGIREILSCVSAEV